MSDTVLVTGATGFIAQHCIVQLLDAGYVVRGTARSTGRTHEIAEVLKPHLTPDARARLESDFDIVPANLTSDEGWDAAVAGCTFVLHVASPFLSTLPKDENELIVPARDGTLRVLHAAHAAGVRRVVLTSSMAAIAYGRDRQHRFTEADWSDVDGPHIGAYEKSKTLAERAAWQFVASLGDSPSMDLVALNPGVVLGPLLSHDVGTSGELVKKLLNRDVPAIPDVQLPLVDVRDVATAHLRAMTTPSASGQRYVCTLDGTPLRDVAIALAKHFQGQGLKVPTGRLPKIALRLVAIRDKQVRIVLAEVGRPFRVDNSKIRRELAINFRDVSDMAISMAESLIAYGHVVPRSG